jgi:uracil-DNA glycosylase
LAIIAKIMIITLAPGEGENGQTNKVISRISKQSEISRPDLFKNT